MPAAKKTTKITMSSSDKDTTIEFIKQIQTIHKTMDNFTKAVENLDKMKEDNFQNLNLHLKQKQIELENLEKKYEEAERQKKLDVELNIRQYQYEEAMKILESRGEMSVNKNDYKKLRDDYKTAVESTKSEVNSALQSERKRNERCLKTMKETLELKNKAEVAKVEAQLEAQNKEIKGLHNTIERLGKDIDEQRKLTKDVAQAAASKSSPVYIPQSRNNN